MITARQVRAARALLDWSQQTLADKAVISLNALVRFEAEAVDTRSSTVKALQITLIRAGVRFWSSSDMGEGVSISIESD